jgi:uncharacterized protein YecE (DUF72 family)
MEKLGVLRVGTSGWHYMAWRGPFYPERMPSTGFLAHYARRFPTAEINNSFYQMPKPATLAAWREAVPPGFVFAVKASRFTTHMKKLKEPEKSCLPFLERVAVLGEKLGPILFQLPPRWRFDAERLAAFLAALPPGMRYAFELRDPSWLVDEAYALLREAGAAFCVYDYAGRESPRIVTSDFVYVRLHGPEERPYHGGYDGGRLAAWAAEIRAWRARGLDVYVYFDNDVAGHAPNDALALRALLEAGEPAPASAMAGTPGM